MNRMIIARIAACCAVLAVAAPASASSDDNCHPAANAPWLSIEDARTSLEAQGFTVRKIETEDGCYEAYALSKSGERVKLYIDPTSLQIVGRRTQS